MKCKRCGNDILAFIKDYERYEDDEMEIIDVYKCYECQSIHWENDTHDFYEFFVGEIVKSNAVSGWATSNNAK